MKSKKPPYSITKWVVKKYIPWLESEKDRLRLLGWRTDLKTKKNKYTSKYRLYRYL